MRHRTVGIHGERCFTCGEQRIDTQYASVGETGSNRHRQRCWTRTRREHRQATTYPSSCDTRRTWIRVQGGPSAAPPCGTDQSTAHVSHRHHARHRRTRNVHVPRIGEATSATHRHSGSHERQQQTQEQSRPQRTARYSTYCRRRATCTCRRVYVLCWMMDSSSACRSRSGSDVDKSCDATHTKHQMHARRSHTLQSTG